MFYLGTKQNLQCKKWWEISFCFRHFCLTSSFQGMNSTHKLGVYSIYTLSYVLKILQWHMVCVQSRIGSFGFNVNCSYLIPLPQFPRDGFQECKGLLSKIINNWYSHKYKTLFTWVFVSSITALSTAVKYTKTEMEVGWRPSHRSSKHSS